MSRKQNLLRNLQELGRIEPGEAATEGAIGRARSALEDSKPEVRRLLTRFIRPRILAPLGAVAAIIFLVTQWILTGSNSIAFAQVQEQVAKTKSVQYKVNNRHWRKHSKYIVEDQGTTMILGSALMRVEMHIKLVDSPWVGENNIFSTAGGFFPGHAISVLDNNRGELLLIRPDEKTYEIIREGSESWAKPDFYRQIRELPREPSKILPEQDFDGKKAVGFVYEKKFDDLSYPAVQTRTFWIDINTKLPIRIESKSRGTRQDSEESDYVTSEIVFDAPLDQALFSTEPPPGYTNLAQEAQPKAEPEGDMPEKTEFVFEEVQKEVEKAKTVQYDETIKSVLSDGSQLADKKRVMILGNHLKREERDLKVTDKDGKEIPSKTQHTVQVFDAEKESLLALFPDKRGYLINNYSTPHKGNGFKPAVTASLFLKGGFYDLIRDVPVKDAKKLPDRTINGKRAIGFLVEEKQDTPVGTQTWQRTFWVDAETKLPIQIEVRFRPGKIVEKKDDKTISLQVNGQGQMDDELRDIVFDAPLDEKLFSLEPPEGYANLAKSKNDEADSDARARENALKAIQQNEAHQKAAEPEPSAAELKAAIHQTEQDPNFDKAADEERRRSVQKNLENIDQGIKGYEKKHPKAGRETDTNSNPPAAAQ